MRTACGYRLAMRKIKPHISINEFAGLAEVGATTAYRWSRQGLLDSLDVGKRKLDRKLAVEWIAANVKAKAKA